MLRLVNKDDRKCQVLEEAHECRAEKSLALNFGWNQTLIFLRLIQLYEFEKFDNQLPEKTGLYD